MRTRYILTALGGAMLAAATPASAQVTMPEGIPGQSIPPNTSLDTLTRDDPEARRRVPPSVYQAAQERADGNQDVTRPRARTPVPQANSRTKAVPGPRKRTRKRAR